MRYALQVRLVVLLLVGFTAGACDNGETPTTPSPNPTVTETFTGTVTRNGARIHSFIATASGLVTATITAVDPAGSPPIGFSLGTWDGTVCTVVQTINAATISSGLSGTVVGITSLCIILFDPFGNVPADVPVNYTVTVVRP